MPLLGDQALSKKLSLSMFEPESAPGTNTWSKNEHIITLRNTFEDQRSHIKSTTLPFQQSTRKHWHPNKLMSTNHQPHPNKTFKPRLEHTHTNEPKEDFKHHLSTQLLPSAKQSQPGQPFLLEELRIDKGSEGPKLWRPRWEWELGAEEGLVSAKP